MAVESVFEEIRTRLEERIKRQLSGLQGFVVKPVYNSIMPLHVEISLVSEVFEFMFLKDGVVKFSHGYGSNADVRIETDTQSFMSLFQGPSAELFNKLEREGKIRVVALTRKGKDAEGYVRRYLLG